MEKDYGPIRVILMKAGKQSNGDVITYDVMKQMAVENATGSIPVYDCEDPVKRHIIGTLQVKPEIEAADMIIRRVSNEAPPALPISRRNL